jgi:UDP-N-acetylmuramyl pentapeptide phosphotransferase/UDP-N-acetylglucosamine-1-phosphate transferase
MIRWLPSIVGILLLVFLMSGVETLLQKCRVVKPNFKGKIIVQGYGLVTLLWSLAIYALLMLLFEQARHLLPVWTLTVCSFGALGFLDDVWGGAENRGFRGHLRALLKQHKVTTGIVKAVGGLAMGVIAGFMLWPSLPLRALLCGLEIALCANFFNLLDLRPGRSGAMFLVAAIVLAAAAHAAWPLWIVVIPAWAVWLRDSRAQVMMGDCGANLIGAALGLGIAVAAGMSVLVAATGLLALLTVVSESVWWAKRPTARQACQMNSLRKMA